MRRVLLLAAWVAAAGCADGGDNPVSARGTRPELAVGPPGPGHSVFTTQQPVDTAGVWGSWEVATRFKASEPGRVVGFRFWRAPGETGTNVGRLWTNAGSLLVSAPFPNYGRSGWDTVYLGGYAPRLAANTYYRVSANTNTEQVRTYIGAPFNLWNGSLTADLSYAGQPIASMPTQAAYSLYFVDVIFIPDGPLPNLYAPSITLGQDEFGDPVAIVQVCNNGVEPAGESITRLEYRRGGSNGTEMMYTPPLAAGSCADLPSGPLSRRTYPDDRYLAKIDNLDDVYESNERDNETFLRR